MLLEATSMLSFTSKYVVNRKSSDAFESEDQEIGSFPQAILGFPRYKPACKFMFELGLRGCDRSWSCRPTIHGQKILLDRLISCFNESSDIDPFVDSTNSIKNKLKCNFVKCKCKQD